MNRIDKKFADLRAEGKKAFIPFITAGDPSLDITVSLVSKLESAGADIIELGVPFSDPVADGLSIQRSSLRALKDNVSLKDVMHTVAGIRNHTQVPIAFLTYYNLIFRHGVKQFVQDAVESGVDGAVIADLPYAAAARAPSRPRASSPFRPPLSASCSRQTNLRPRRGLRISARLLPHGGGAAKSKEAHLPRASRRLAIAHRGPI